MKDFIITTLTTVVLIQDPKSKGYTAYLPSTPSIIAEGETFPAALRNLADAFDVMNEF